MTNKNDYITVREAVEKKILSERDYLYVIYLLTIMLKKIFNDTNGGGHFNINLDTVKVLKEEGKLPPVPEPMPDRKRTPTGSVYHLSGGITRKILRNSSENRSLLSASSCDII